MIKMNKLGLLCVVMALFVAGCGKKKCKKVCENTATTKLASADTSKDIPLLSDDAENLLADSDMAEFAFVDDEANVDGKNSKVVASNDFVDADVDNAAQDESTFDFKAVAFDFNKNDIRVDQKPVVAMDAEVAKRAVAQGKKVVIEGHCDQIGSAAYNLALSQRRAEAVKAEVLKRGVAASNIKTVGYGNERPVVWSDQSDRSLLIKELAPNRRAEVLVN